MFMLLLVCLGFVPLTCAGSLDHVSVEGTQTLLKKWNLHTAFGKEFRELSFDGRFLSMLDMSDYREERYPRATQAHWKVLLKEIQLERHGDASGRRLADTVDTKDFRGVRIKLDKSILALGKNQDVQLARSGDKQLTILADSVRMQNLVVDGMSLGGVDMLKFRQDIQMRIKKIEDSEAAMNLYEPIRFDDGWTKNKEGKWQHSASTNMITNTGAPGTWLYAGWTGQKFSEKNVRVEIKEIPGAGGGGGGTNWGHPGIMYHYVSPTNWEGFYFRPHSTNSNSAVQYTCMVNGKNTFPATNAAPIPTDGSWFTARVKVTNTKATLYLEGMKGGGEWTVDRCTQFVSGGVGIVNHESTSSFRSMVVCKGANCELPKCTPCPSGMLEDTPCMGIVDRKCKKNLFEPIRDDDNWSKNKEGKWTHAASKNMITNTGAPGTWLYAGWTGLNLVEKNVMVDIKEIPGAGGGGGGTNWGHPGIVYHYVSPTNWEGFYFRPHSTNSNSAIQYTCMVNGKNTFPSTNSASIPTDGSWFTVQVKVTKTKATLYMRGRVWTVDRCVKDAAGGVGVINHQSTSSFQNMMLCMGADCKLPIGSKTCGGTAKGAPCVFPFTYNGKTYDDCTTVSHSERWCSTEKVYKSQWGNCLC